MRLTRTGFLRTSMTTLPSSVSSMIGYHAPRRRTSATLSRQRAQPRGFEDGVAMSGANVAHPARFRYAHNRSDHAASNSARLAEARRETHTRLRPQPAALGAGAQRHARRRLRWHPRRLVDRRRTPPRPSVHQERGWTARDLARLHVALRRHAGTLR